MLLELTIGGLLLLAYKRSEKKGVLTKERQEAYEGALTSLTDPDKLRELATIYEKEGLTVEANMLRKRAVLRGQSPAVKAARKAAFDKGMKSNDPAGIEHLANEFEKITATGAASALRARAAELREQGAGKPKHEFSDEPSESAKAAEQEEVSFNSGVNGANGVHKPKSEKPVIDTTAESVE
jgi:hypothetical protein